MNYTKPPVLGEWGDFGGSRIPVQSSQKFEKSVFFLAIAFGMWYNSNTAVPAEIKPKGSLSP